MQEYTTNIIKEGVLRNYPDFVFFLRKQGYEKEHVEMMTPYGVFGWITPYLEDMIKTNRLDQVKDILQYLNSFYKQSNIDINNLLGAGFLENFNTIKTVLPILVPILPAEMHHDFMLHYSHYLSKSLKSNR